MTNTIGSKIVIRDFAKSLTLLLGVVAYFLLPFDSLRRTSLSSLSSAPSLAKCSPVTFSNISPEIWSCLQEHLKQEGISKKSNVVDPSGKESGELSGGLGASAQYNWDRKTQTLEIAFTSLPILYSCAWMESRIKSYLPGCRGGEITKESSSAAEVWRIDTPNVKQRATRYSGIAFRPGDIVTVEAGGCVQTGGHGKTWKRYVDPLGGRSDQLYHGLIRLPGMTAFVRISQLIGNPITIPNNINGDMSLHLGYEDDSYENNGYWGREGDDGEPKQCAGRSNAWVRVKIVRVKNTKGTPPAHK